jgi:hypothetical protein
LSDLTFNIVLRLALLMVSVQISFWAKAIAKLHLAA